MPYTTPNAKLAGPAAFNSAIMVVGLITNGTVPDWIEYGRGHSIPVPYASIERRDLG